MPSVRVVELIEQAKTILQEEAGSGVRWTVIELQDWLNAAYRDVVTVRPDAYSKGGTYQCVAGPRQVVTGTFADAVKLLDVVRNVAATSTKNAVIIADRRLMDAMRRNWYGDTPSASIELCMFDPVLPLEFLVYPAATTAAQLEIVYSSVPPPHTLIEPSLTNPANQEVIRITDNYANALIDLMLYRAYSKDRESTASAARAVAHYQAAIAALTAQQASNP
jgi:hypothetical protein